MRFVWITSEASPFYDPCVHGPYYDYSDKPRRALMKKAKPFPISPCTMNAVLQASCRPVPAIVRAAGAVSVRLSLDIRSRFLLLPRLAGVRTGDSTRAFDGLSCLPVFPMVVRRANMSRGLPQARKSAGNRAGVQSPGLREKNGKDRRRDGKVACADL